jgi:hypothetical protein
MCANDPVNGIDPLGLSWLSACFGFGRTGPEADSFDAEMSDQFWSGKIGQRGLAAVFAGGKVAIGVGEAALGAKATVASGGLAATAGYTMAVDGASRASGGITDYINILRENDPVASGDVIEQGFKAGFGDRAGANARDITSAVLTAGGSALLMAQRETAAAAQAQAIAKQPKAVPAAESRWKVHTGKQGKHIPGHNNYIEGRSRLTHPDPQKLVDDFAGTGQQAGSIPAGQPGFKERVDFGQVIGEFVDPVTGQGVETTVGIIHYAKDGVHIVPARPGG